MEMEVEMAMVDDMKFKSITNALKALINLLIQNKERSFFS